MANGHRALALAGALVLSISISLSACGSDDSSDSGSGGNGASAGSGGSSASGGGSTSDAFAACGAKIVDPKTSAIDADEYKLQATLWDRATIDCRLGPGYDQFHPDKKQDVRPTAPEVPLTPNPGAIFLCKDYQYGTPGSGTDFGSTSGQVAYASADTSDLGIDRLQTAGWESGIECYNPQQGGYLGGPHPDPAVAQWVTAEGPLGLPRGMARTENVETGDGIVIFTTGHVGATGTQTSGSTNPIVKLPPNKIPTAVALTTYNEFALVTVWDTAAIKGQVAVFALRAPSPGAFSINLYGAPNEAGFDRIQLLGFVDLPDMATPTAIAAGGNNGSYPSAWLSEGTHAYQGLGSIFADTSYAGLLANDGVWLWTGDPAKDKAVFATDGGAIVASQWENEITVLDLAPLFSFVRKQYVDPIANSTDEAAFTTATTSDPWAFDFEKNPEMKPTVLSSFDFPAPRQVQMGNRASGDPARLNAWIAGFDSNVKVFDASRFAGIPELADASFDEVGSVKVDPNVTSLVLTGGFTRGESAELVSRGNRSLQWVGFANGELSVMRTLRDSRLNDPVELDVNDRRGVQTVADFTAGKVLNYEIREAECADAGPDAGSCEQAYFDGELALPGSVYFVDTANVN